MLKSELIAKVAEKSKVRHGEAAHDDSRFIIDDSINLPPC